MSIGILGGLGEGGGRIGALLAGNLYLDYFRGGLPPKGDMDVGGIAI